MTRSERSILDYLAGTRDRIVNAHELRDAIGSKTEDSIKVLVHRLRAGGTSIESHRGCYGGYRLPPAPVMVTRQGGDGEAGSVHDQRGAGTAGAQ